ncbi:hypothetical protein FRC05_008718 [Tulasnella sp. 425]|nr:hypothetical protein FRC05_008718 [Tulasnella sp. 425]
MYTGNESPVTAIHPRSPRVTAEPSESEPQVRTRSRNDAVVGRLVPAAVVLLLIARLIYIESAPGRILSPPLEEKDDQFWEGPGNATCYPALPSVLPVMREPVQGYTLDFDGEYQAEEEGSLIVLSEPADISPNVNTHHGPAVPSPARYQLEGPRTSPKDANEDESLSFGHLFYNDDGDEEDYDDEELLAPIKHCSFKFPPATLRTNPASQVSSHPGDYVRVDEKAEPEELEDPLASDPQAREPIGTGIGDLSAQVSGTPIPDTGSTRACSLRFASTSTPTPRKPQDSDAALSAQVSGTASKTGFLGNLRGKFKAAAASAKRSRVIVQASLGRIKTAGKRGFRSRKAAVPEQPTAPLSAGDREETEQKPKKVVRFSHFVQVREAPRSPFDEFARTGFKDRETERDIRRAYRTWIRGKWREVDSVSDDVGYFCVDDGDIDDEGFSKNDQEKAMANSRRSAQSRRGGGLAFYGASTSRDGSRQLSEEEWQELEEFQSVRSGTPLDLDLVIEVIYKILLELTEAPQPSPVPADKRSFGSSTKRG